MGGAAVSSPKGLEFDSHLTGFTGHASKPMEHGLWGFEQGFVLSDYPCDAVGSNKLRGGGYPSMIPIEYGTF